MVLLRIILLLIIIYYVLKLIGRLIFPYVFTRKINKNEQQRQKSWDDFLFRKKYEEGNVTVDYNSKNKKSRNKDGEYIDYEEVK